MFETNLFSVLSAASGITAITGANIFPVELPKDPTLPALTYRTITSVASPTFTTSGLQRARVEIDCWGSRYLDAVNLRTAVIGALNGYVDANFTILLISFGDVFKNELLQYAATVEFYLFFTL
jgi:hypothetical protein